jgi:hypothetical protein
MTTMKLTVVISRFSGEKDRQPAVFAPDDAL